MSYTWELRNPDGAMLGVEWARGRCAAREAIIAHSLPERVDVVVRDDRDAVVARADGLAAAASTPMARLSIVDGSVTREAIWPTADDIGSLVILPGGEIAELLSWWNADDGSEWRWRVEFHNRR